jgi:hypothetical protein
MTDFYTSIGYLGNDLQLASHGFNDFAKETFLRLARETVGEYLGEAKTSWKLISDNYRSANPPLEPADSLRCECRRP